MTQDRPEEFKLYRLNPPSHAEADDFERRRFVNIVALFAMLALVASATGCSTPWITAADFSNALILAAAIALVMSTQRPDGALRGFRP